VSGTEIWAHRGASAVEPENTLGAFAAAVRMGADGIELDVRATADGLPAILHDAVLPDGRPLATVLAAGLPPHVPLLGAALEACADLTVNIEIKEPPELAELVVAEVRRRGMAGRVVVSCFDLATVDRVHALDPDLATALLVFEGPDRDRAGRLIDLCRRRGHRAVHPHHLAVDAHFVDLAAGAGVDVNVWTVDDPARVAALAALGVHAIVTNVPDVALRALGR
jgi:glycerophosphoryl diester phosphodiesterase